MALRRCRECTTAFAVGLLACPHCQSTDHEEDGAMPKIHTHREPTSRYEIQGEHGPELVSLPVGDAVYPAGEGSEEPSASSSSETSTEKPPSTPEKSKEPSPKRARTTGSRSGKARTGSSSARSTDGGRAADTSAADGGE